MAINMKSVPPGIPILNAGPEYDFEPTGNLVLLEKMPDSLSPAGLVLPEGPSKPSVFKVVRVGPGRFTLNGTLLPVGVKVGDIVALWKERGVVMNIVGCEYLIADEDAIFAILHPKRPALDA